MEDPDLTANTALETLAERVVERTVGPCHLLTLQTPVSSVVSCRGSFKAHPDVAQGDVLLQELTVSLLDKGTQHRDRFATAEVLENRGAKLNFNSDGLYVEFAARMLREHVTDVLDVLAEQLIDPLFDPVEFEKAKAQMAASLQRSMESTGKQARGALTRGLYGKAHPNYTPAPERRLERLQSLTVEEVRAYHEQHFGATDLILVLVGDLEDEVIDRVVRARFGEWAPHESPARFEAQADPQAPGRVTVPIPDKQNIDVRMGHPLRIRRQDEDYVPLYLANYILGGNFSARLMAVIRDEMGLTYGIRSGLSGISTQYEGHWQVGVTLSREKVEEGLAATVAEVERFVDEGATESELQDKKTTVTGGFKVGLATTKGLASALLKNAERGFNVDYLDRFPAKVEAVTLAETNKAIQRHFEPDQFHVALAGHLAEAKPAAMDA